MFKVELGDKRRHVLLTIDLAGSTPLFEQIAAAVRRGILEGTIHSGERMPPAAELSASLDVNRNTVLHAYQLLRDEGLLELRRGRGATITVKADSLRGLSAAMSRLITQARDLGVSADALASLVKESYA